MRPDRPRFQAAMADASWDEAVVLAARFIRMEGIRQCDRRLSHLSIRYCCESLRQTSTVEGSAATVALVSRTDRRDEDPNRLHLRRCEAINRLSESFCLSMTAICENPSPRPISPLARSGVPICGRGSAELQEWLGAELALASRVVAICAILPPRSIECATDAYHD